MAASGTEGTPITVLGYSDPTSHATTAYLAAVLRQLGFQVTVREFDRATTNLVDYAAGSRQVWGALQAQGWQPDYPAASNFYFNLVACRAANNPTQYCNPKLDALARAARAAEGTDMAAARRQWATVDRLLTDDAPWVDEVNSGENTFVSARVGNYQSSPELGPLLDQIWVR